MDNKPIFRITKIDIKKEDVEAFVSEQEAELENSIPVEDGTLFFASAHEGDEGTTNYVVDLFRNSEAYEEHSLANYIDHYNKVMDKMAVDKKVYDLNPEWITTKPVEALNSYANDFAVRLTKVEIQDKMHDKFADIVKKEMRRAMAQEAGVEIMMAASNKENANEWLFFEVYSDRRAYDIHIKQKWFIDYIKDSENIIKDRQIHELTRDVMASQGQIVLD
ncbi:antibiotic biosynthesis monooxygenase [Lactobacillus agrestimuris]|uniref:antibiotic biosynthesis monooxygenase n=1 Tax=Lactobacillus agrestimuris TaxID=2941328 RepID=UPI002043CB91|nr:antibiotic biosynthesis monooxygenase [Lactobacillus agrestimuris]